MCKIYDGKWKYVSTLILIIEKTAKFAIALGSESIT